MGAILKSKEKMFKITSVVMESGCTKYLLYRNHGIMHMIFFGTRYSIAGKFDSMEGAMECLNSLYQREANSCTKSKEVKIWPMEEN